MAKRKNADEDLMEIDLNKKVRMDLNTSDTDQQFVLTKEIVENTILTDLSQKSWRAGKPIGKGSFGEIFLASDNTSKPVTSDNAKYVVKIEPHSNGPLFVEIHCLLKTGKRTETESLPLGMPEYIASGSHYFQNSRYRFLILHRYKYDLHSIIKNRRVDPKCVLIIASQIIDILEHFHDKGYAHSDIKAENLMIGSCTYNKINSPRKWPPPGCHAKPSPEKYQQKTPRKSEVEFSGTQPMRSCRSNRKTSIYDDMLKSHYLRPTKKINYTEENYIESNMEKHDADFMPESRKNFIEETEDRIFLIDFGLASKFIDASGQHHSFCMDQRRAHDGTLEFTSRDAHMGAHSRRSDLESLGYNLIYWCQGTLPWKDEKLLQQPEQVHRMKEYFMTDVKFMLQQIYGRDFPKFLAEFMKYVGNLAYDERPDYQHCKYIFEKAFVGMGFNIKNMKLDVEELKTKVHKIKKLKTEDEIKQYKDIKSIMKLGVILPFKESNFTPSKVSPKNLRSKIDNVKKKKKFSWTEILSTDPDQIARQRAEKEFEREQTLSPMTPRYTGQPTYAIIEIENKMKFKDKLESKDDDQTDLYIKGYTKPMMDILKKRQYSIIQEFEKQKNKTEEVSLKRSRPGLRNNIISTKKSISYKKSIENKRNKSRKYNNNSSNYSDASFVIEEESSSSNHSSNSSNHTSNASNGYNSSEEMSCHDSTDDHSDNDDDNSNLTDYYNTPIKMKRLKKQTSTLPEIEEEKTRLRRKLRPKKVSRKFSSKKGMNRNYQNTKTKERAFSRG